MDEVEETETLKHQEETHKRKNPKVVFWNFIWRPVYWFRMLGDELHWSFVLSVVIVYGMNQGLSVGLSRVSTQYYMKDEQKVQPSEAQVFFGMIQLPWVIKPLWGLLTDILPIIGYRRRPYFIFAVSSFAYFRMLEINWVLSGCITIESPRRMP
ncbi:putative folate-biopterin transporter 3 [Vitis vinifera]|uniref:Putative folate-biopterin transporter 3 n=1 Tax=Vitis vinifera TaxID=29760 RepID=A0A438FES0_VITVI|nr:putative folate-biopterin transporter 3 [Vitis vinifera]